MSLSQTQQAILALIGERIATEGVPPSQTEIAVAFGFSGVRAAQYHLQALEQAGAIRRMPGKARGIQLLTPHLQEPADEATKTVPGSSEALHLPVLGQVAAGIPIGADIGSEAWLLVDRGLFSPAPDYLLKVKGDSMRDEGIFHGDLIGVHRTRDARSGQIVVARIDDEITVKLLKIGKDHIRLVPRNPDYSTIEVRPDQDFAIEGLYCGLIRPREHLSNSDVPRAMDGAPANRARQRSIQREQVRACTGLATSEPVQDGLVQTLPSTSRSH